MATTLEDLASGLSLVLKEPVHIENECIVLGGNAEGDYLVLQLGANDKQLYLTIPIIDIDESGEKSAAHLSALMELNGDTKNYPLGRIAYNAIAGSAHWIELIEKGFSAKDLVGLIEARGKLIAQIRYALNSTEKA